MPNMLIRIFNTLFAFLLVLYPFIAIGADKVVLPADYKPFYLSNNWRVTPLASYNTDEEKRAIAFIIDKNDDLGIHFITYMLSNKPNDWKGCSPFIINAMTKSKELFFNDEALLNIFVSVQNYADILCPNTREMLFFASEKPYNLYGVDLPSPKGKEFIDESIFFVAKISKDEEKKWQISPENILNRIQQKNIKLGKKLSLIQKEYEILKSSSFEKIASLQGKEKLDNPAIIHTLAEITEKGVPFTSLLHLKGADWVDIPIPLKILVSKPVLPKTEGWYLITGTMQALSNKDKMNYGIKPKDKAGTIEINNAYRCETEQCSERPDIIAFLRDKYNLPDWKPLK